MLLTEFGITEKFFSNNDFLTKEGEAITVEEVKFKTLNSLGVVSLAKSVLKVKFGDRLVVVIGLPELLAGEITIEKVDDYLLYTSFWDALMRFMVMLWGNSLKLKIIDNDKIFNVPEESKSYLYIKSTILKIQLEEYVKEVNLVVKFVNGDCIEPKMIYKVIGNRINVGDVEVRIKEELDVILVIKKIERELELTNEFDSDCVDRFKSFNKLLVF